MTVMRYAFVGDSITAGTGDDDFLGWPGRVCVRERKAGHDVTLYNLGVRGDTSALIEPRWRKECEARFPPDVPCAIVFAFGINDSAEDVGKGLRVPLPESLKLARKMLTEAKAWRPTLWIGPTPVDETLQPMRPRPGMVYDFRNARIVEYSKAYAVLAAELGAPYLDCYAPFEKNAQIAADLHALDGVHPLRDGYGLMAERVAAWPAWRKLLDS